MHPIFRKTVLAMPLLIALCGNTFASPKITIKDANQPQGFATTPLPHSLVGVVKELEAKNPDLYEVVVYPFKDHYILYLLSGKYWKATEVRVDLDSSGGLKAILNPYSGDGKDFQGTSWDNNKKAKCPDETVQFVAMSAYPNVGKVKESINVAVEAAQLKYKTVTVLGNEANGEAYKNWLSCSNLKGFYTIGHGSTHEIIVGGGDRVSYTFFESKEFDNKYRNTTLVINSCLVYNNPFGTELIFGNALYATDFEDSPGPSAYQYMGGFTNLLIGPSELSSACFIKNAIGGAKMDYENLRKCIGNQDIHYQDFGLAYPGRTFSS